MTTTETSVTTDHIIHLTDPWNVLQIFLVLDIIVTSAVVVTNVVVLILVLKPRRKQPYIISLMTANLSAGLLALPLAILTHFGHSRLNLSCQIFQYLIHVAEFAEIYSLVAIAVDRYLVVVNRQLDGSSKSKIPTRFGVVIIWTASIVYSTTAPFLFEHRMVVIVNEDVVYHLSECVFREMPIFQKTFVIVNTLVLFVAPLVIITIAYGALVLYLTHESRTYSASTVNNRRKVVRTVLILVGIFIVFNLPLLTLNIYITFGPGHFAFEAVLLEALELGAMLNFCVNPFVYSLMSSSVKLRGCLKSGNSVSDSEHAGDHHTNPTASHQLVRVMSRTYSTVHPMPVPPETLSKF